MAKHEFASISLTVWHRAILSKFSTHRVSKQCTLGNFKKFSPPQKWRPFWIFEFFPKMAKHKIASISLTMRDRAILSKFSTHSLSQKCTLSNFKKISPPKKWRPFWIFEFLPKMAKHEFASISLTVRDRAISSKLSSNRVSDQCTLCNFPKIFPSPKMAAFLNFRIFPKNGKTQNCFYLLNRMR